MLSNYEQLLETLHTIMTGCGGGSCVFEVTSKASIHARLEIFDTLFGKMLGQQFYFITDKLSCSLQRENVTASDAKLASAAVCTTL